MCLPARNRPTITRRLSVPSHHALMRVREQSARTGRLETASRGNPCGFTLVELIIAMTITSMVSVVIAGLVNAVQTAWDFSTNLEDTQVQANASIERITFAVGNARCYRLAGAQPIPGIAVVTHSWSILSQPDTLVVWNGGRNGFSPARLASVGKDGHFTSLPLTSELTVFGPDPNNPGRLLEVTFPSSTGSVDFQSAAFAGSIRTLVASGQAEIASLSDRVRATRMPVSGNNPSLLSNVRFEVESTPSQAQLSATTPGTMLWKRLPWVQGVCGDDFGLRQVSVRIEIQLETNRGESATGPVYPLFSGVSPPTTSLPFFGAASIRYVHQAD